MDKAGGIIALIAGVLGIVAGFFTLFVGGIGSAFESNEADSTSSTLDLGRWGPLHPSVPDISLQRCQVSSVTSRSSGRGKTSSSQFLPSFFALLR